MGGKQGSSRRSVCFLWGSMRWLLSALLATLFSYALAQGSTLTEQEQYEQLLAGQSVFSVSHPDNSRPPTVYLTFDDGPSKLTPQVLDILKEAQVPASFFVLGEQVKARPEVAARIVAEGHAIGNHTYNHRYEELYRQFDGFWEQVQQTEAVIKEATGITTPLLRAPGGTFTHFDAFYHHYLSQAGYVVHDWNIDSGDAARPGVTADEMIRTISKSKLPQQAIVLLHDSSGHEETVLALPRIIEWFKEKGYTFAKLDETVKPVVFRTGKLKWSRQVSYEQHVRYMTDVRALALQKEVKQAPRSTYGLKQLVIYSSDQPLKLNADQFFVRDHRVQAPLRAVTEHVGGVVTWLPEQRTAVAKLGNRIVEADLSRLEMRVYEVWQGKKIGLRTDHLPAMELVDGALYVPLRAFVQDLGLSLTRVAYDEARTELAVQVKNDWRLGLFGYVRWV